MMGRLIGSLYLSGWTVGIIVILSQFLAAAAANARSYRALYRLYPYFRPRRWEKDGAIYQEILHVRSWKEYVPVIGRFDKKRITGCRLDPSYISMYILESLRAELCHGYAFMLSLLICIFTGPAADIRIMLWSICLNAPCIIIQRYNRPRFERLAAAKRPDGTSGLVRFWEADGRRIRNPGRM